MWKDICPAGGSCTGGSRSWGVESWTFVDGFIERLRYEVDPQWRGEIPRTVLIARDGTTRVIEGIVDATEIKRWLDGQTGRPK